MKTLKVHIPVLLLMLAISLSAFGRIMTTPLFNPLDFQIIKDAHLTSSAPWDMFGHLGTYFSQPFLNFFFLGEYLLFGLNQKGYMAVNLALNGLNAFLLYMLVNMLFNRRNMAILAGVLFAFTVGSYGKILTTVAGQESLLMVYLHLVVLYFFIRNDFRHQGRLRSPFFLLGLGVFLVAGLTKTATFSLMGCLLAYKVFFHRGKGLGGIFTPSLLALLVVGVLFQIARGRWGYQAPISFQPKTDALDFTWLSIKNIFRYLNLMVFPLQPSSLVEEANVVVQLVFEIRTIIRVLLTMAIISFSFFGFVFGSRALRFFIAWTYITLLPFTGVSQAASWLNLQHLYLTSFGYCVILAAGTRGMVRLLEIRRWRRLVPYVFPLAYVLLAVFVTHELNAQNRRRAMEPAAIALRAELREFCQIHGPQPDSDR